MVRLEPASDSLNNFSHGKTKRIPHRIVLARDDSQRRAGRLILPRRVEKHDKRKSHRREEAECASHVPGSVSVSVDADEREERRRRGRKLRGVPHARDDDERANSCYLDA